ncbi:hypothetical protein [Aurantibacillus circumpalustris]|uniref:hypothetical protein n=1 Tax=Aurantibacillus circumpalustris TaxID=3036359 RepID=UPI00295AF44F|nr:hypothetical protein [Aurantibacillus circumpalustris]
MKKLISLILMFAMYSGFAQRGKAKMLPVLEKGYYINTRNDTVWGKVQTNPEDPTDLYKQFGFKNNRSKKPKMLNAQRAKAYGVGDKDYVSVELNGKKIFLQRLVTGRLNFYQYEYNGKIEGYAAIESDFYIKDTGADPSEADLKELKKISGLFYKRGLKPYFKDQPMIWSDLDKYNFDEVSVIAAVKEFNKFYSKTGN